MPWTIDEIINRHTLWPFYFQFVESKKIEKVKDSIIFGPKGNPLLLPQLNAPFYCPECVQIQLAKGEAPFWNRVHQLPNIQICTIHDIFLEQVESHPLRAALHYLYIPSEKSCSKKLGRPNKSSMLFDIAQQMIALLNGRCSMDLNFRERFIELGYIQHKRLDRRQIFSELGQFYSSEFLNSFNLKISHLAHLLDGARTDNNPIKHVLLDYFLSTLSFKPEKREYNSLNKYLEDQTQFCCSKEQCSKRAAIEPLTPNYRYINSGRKVFAYFKCYCEVNYVMSFSLTSNDGTVIIKKSRYVRRLEPDRAQIESKRNLYIKLYNEISPSASQKIKLSSTRNWLKKYDPSWIKSQQQHLHKIKLKKRKSRKEITNREQLVRLKAALQELIQLDLPRRITASAITRTAKVPSKKQSNLVLKFLKQNSESVNEFRIRMIKRRANESFRLGKTPSAKKLLSTFHSKVQKELYPDVEKLITQLEKQY